jgi:hypothetical protein
VNKVQLVNKLLLPLYGRLAVSQFFVRVEGQEMTAFEIEKKIQNDKSLAANFADYD